MIENTSVSQERLPAILDQVFPNGVLLGEEFGLDGQDFQEVKSEVTAAYWAIAPQKAREFFARHKRVLVPLEWLEVVHGC